MKRFHGNPLGPDPSIVVLGSVKLGNYVVLQPLLRGLRQCHPTARITHVGSRRTHELERLNPWIDACLPLAEKGAQAAPLLKAWRERRRVDLVINADGHSSHTPGWVSVLRPRYVVGFAPIAAGSHPLQRLAVDPDWAHADLVDRYRGWIGSNSIRELHCRVAWVQTDFEHVELPQAPPPAGLPGVLLAVNGERSAKIWPGDHWLALVRRLNRELGLAASELGLIGAPPSQGREGPGKRVEEALVAAGVVDLRGRLGLPELVGAMADSRLCIAVDSGPMHLAAAAGCPTVAIFGTDPAGIGASARDLWVPRSPNVFTSSSPASCRACYDQRYRNDDCLVEGHPCLRELGPADLWPLILSAWSRGRDRFRGKGAPTGPASADATGHGAPHESVDGSGTRGC